MGGVQPRWFRQLDLCPKPHVYVGVGSGGHGAAFPPGFSNMVFFGLFCYFLVFFAIFLSLFSRCPPSLEIFLPTPLLMLLLLNYSYNFLLTRDSNANHLNIIDKNAYFLFKILQFLLVGAQKILLPPGAN